jgi:hypothetical protein
MIDINDINAIKDHLKDMQTELYIQKRKESKYNYNAFMTPLLSFPSHWQILLMPPMNAYLRFRVSLKDTDVVENNEDIEDVSVYLDIEDSLGDMGKPYWEIYPDANGSNSRFALEDTKELLAGIEESLQEIKKRETVLSPENLLQLQDGIHEILGVKFRIDDRDAQSEDEMGCNMSVTWRTFTFTDLEEITVPFTVRTLLDLQSRRDLESRRLQQVIDKIKSMRDEH